MLIVKPIFLVVVNSFLATKSVMTKITFKNLILTTIIALTTIITITTVSGTDASAAPDPMDTFIGDFKDGPIAVYAEDGFELGYYGELHVEHPFYVSSRPSFAKSADPSDPVLIEKAFLSNTWTNLRDNNGNLIQGATIEQYWIAVSPEDAIALHANGYALTGSSGGFSFKLVKQIASQEAQDAFGAVTIDNSATGDAIAAINTAEGFCG